MLIDEQAFKASIQEAVIEAINSQKQDEYEGFANVERFIKISGISKFDLEEKLMVNPIFTEHVYRLQGTKRYIDIKPALESVRKIMRNGVK